MSASPHVLPERATIAAAAELVAVARAHEASDAFVIDASSVEAIDGPAVLAIASIAQSLPTRGSSVAVIRPTSAFVDAFTDLGLFQDLMKMEFRK